ncbi:MAG TPA: AAA family ATPase [Azospirillum sp.]|nr:AAA family ATPase [Azospirillum sp.]
MSKYDDVFESPGTKQPVILSVYNQKGGVGKTTTSVNLAVSLAALGKNVVLIDFDPQSSASGNFLLEKEAKIGIHDLLNQEVFIEDAVTPTTFDGLSMVSGARKLYSLEHALDRQGGSQRKLRRALHFTENAPDYIVIDCPPALGHLAAGALAASDRLIVPVFPGGYALDGLKRTLTVVEHIQNGMNPHLKLAGILMLSLTNDQVGRESLAKVGEEYADLMFRTAVPYDADVVKATYRRMPASIFNPEGRTTARFLALAWEIIHGRGKALPDAEQNQGLQRIQQWHEATSASYASAHQAGSVTQQAAPAAEAKKAGKSRVDAFVVALVMGLVAGFALGVTAGERILDTVWVRSAP